MNLFHPDIYAQSIYTINYDKLFKNGIRVLLFDLDNTCIPYLIKEPTKELKNHFDKLTSDGFKVIIFSNSPKKRLKPFKDYLNVDCCAKVGKPKKTKLLRILKDYNLSLPEVAIIGDQLMTDIFGGNRVGINTILVNPISNIDMPFTRINRMMEKRIIKKMEKKALFSLGEYYD